MLKNVAELIGRVQDSDTEAFRILFEEYQPILFRNVLHRLRDPDICHDVVQETFVRVWQRRSSLKPELSFLAYVFRISSNIILDFAKHREVRERLEADVPPPSQSSESDPESTLEANFLERRIAELMRTKLPPKCCRIFLLSRMEELSNAEISALLGVSVKTVENQITRALKILRRHLRGYTNQGSR